MSRPLTPTERKRKQRAKEKAEREQQERDFLPVSGGVSWHIRSTLTESGFLLTWDEDNPTVVFNAMQEFVATAGPLFDLDFLSRCHQAGLIEQHDLGDAAASVAVVHDMLEAFLLTAERSDGEA